MRVQRHLTVVVTGDVTGQRQHLGLLVDGDLDVFLVGESKKPSVALRKAPTPVNAAAPTSQSSAIRVSWPAVPKIPTPVSLAVIVVILATVTVTSLRQQDAERVSGQRD